MSSSTSLLFHPIAVGDMPLKHRIVMAPLTRLRNDVAFAPGPLNLEYYQQRSSTPGTLIIAEGTCVAHQATGLNGSPGIWSEKQIAAWKTITDAVHAHGSYVFVQLFAFGAAAIPSVIKKDGYPYVSASDVQIEDRTEAPRPMTIPEIQEYIQLFTTAAANAVKAGFDGVEVHGANGYLLDQFIQTNTNRRTDQYGGSVENRIRFPLEVLDAVVKAIGVKKVGFRISPWGRFQSMRMPDDDLKSTFSELVTRIRDLYPDLAYLHVIQPGIDGGSDRAVVVGSIESDLFLREIWGDRAYIAAGGFRRESAMKWADDTGGLVAFGRSFIANPDLPVRLKGGIPLNAHNRSTFYTQGSIGYTDYPFAQVAT
ncbi:hypothetical protein OF83DRAFT_1069197 [Amylostereum chailletii]|nr:hypothetical protein OF83DRAFT_1069197 [Amylostereum chailletii]